MGKWEPKNHTVYRADDGEFMFYTEINYPDMAEMACEYHNADIDTLEARIAELEQQLLIEKGAAKNAAMLSKENTNGT